jgi:hypothetical protein
MQSIVAISIALFVAVASAAPASSTTTVQFTDDATGLSANVAVPFNDAQNVPSLLSRGPLDVDGTFFATSFFLQANFQGVECDLILPSHAITISEQHTFAGFAPASAPFNLIDAEIICFSN